eukprot:Sdes_comp20274_c0_seq1m13826
MKLFTGAETGIIKRVDVTKFLVSPKNGEKRENSTREEEILNLCPQNRSKEVMRFCWDVKLKQEPTPHPQPPSENSHQCEFDYERLVVAHSDLTIGIYEILKEEENRPENFLVEIFSVSKYFENFEPSEKTGKEEKNLGKFCCGLFCSEKFIISGWNDGKILFTDKKTKLTKTFSIPGNLTDFDVLDPLSKIDCKIFCMGGKNQDVKVFNLNSILADEIHDEAPLKFLEPTFKAKNLKNDSLDLSVPIWITKIRFLSCSEIIVGTAFHECKIYQTNLKRRPAKILRLAGENPVTAMEVCRGGVSGKDSVILADSCGKVWEYSIQDFKLLGTFRENSASVRSIASFSQGSFQYIAMVGLDRYLKVYERA